MVARTWSKYGDVKMDKERIKAEASRFCGENMGYIHSEMEQGKKPELMLCGDFLAMMFQTSGIIKRISELTNNPYELTANLIVKMPIVGYENIRQKLKGENFKFKEGHDWQEEWKAEKEKEIKKEANLNNISLAFNLAEMEKKNVSLNNQLVDLKKEYSRNLKAKDEQIKILSKECQVLEHRLKEMEERRIINE